MTFIHRFMAVDSDNSIYERLLDPPNNVAHMIRDSARHMRATELRVAVCHFVTALSLKDFDAHRFPICRDPATVTYGFIGQPP